MPPLDFRAERAGKPMPQAGLSPGESMTDIAFLPATRLASLIRRKKLGSLELLEHYLARIETYNPQVNAVVALDAEGARARARAADAALLRGEVWGPFHGVPMTVKESFDVAGLPTTWGLPAYKDNRATRNAVAVERWLAAGAVVFGKTNVPVLLADGQSANPVYGRTNNPRDLARTPGGSSGGSAAALAAGLTGIEMGSDIASSIRNPAHNNGVFGHKPTYGLIPVRGHGLGDTLSAADISVTGPLARSAADLMPALDALAGPDAIEAAGLRYALPAPRAKALKDFRIGVVLDHPVSPVSDAVRGVLQGLVDFLAGQGVQLSDTARPAIDFVEAGNLFAGLLAAANSARRPQEQFEAILKDVRDLAPGDASRQAHMLRGATAYHRDWLALDEARTRMRWAWHDWFKEYDLLLCPVYPLPPHLHVEDGIQTRLYQVDGHVARHGDLLFWAGLTGVAYLPATAAPAGFTPDGLPVGVQIVGPHFGDRTTIQFAKLLEKHWQGFVPPQGYE
jgi:amidase